MFELLNNAKSHWNSFYRLNPLIPSEKVQLRRTWVKILIKSYGGVGDNVILVTFWLWQIWDIGDKIIMLATIFIMLAISERIESVTNIPKL